MTRKVIVTVYGRAGRGASSAEPRERRHGDEVQGCPAVAVAAAWFTLCCGGADVRVRRSSGGGAREPSVAAAVARSGPTRQRRRRRGSSVLGRQRPRTEARAQEAQWRRRGSHCAAAAIVSVRRGSGDGDGAQCGGGGGTQWPNAAATEVARTPKRLTAETGDGGENLNTGKLKVAAAWFTLCCCGGDVSVRRGGGDGAGAQCGGHLEPWYP